MATTTNAGPVLTDELEQDARTLARHAATAERTLAALPDPAKRDPAQQSIADGARAKARAARRRFLDRHIDAVYDALTHDRRLWIRLPDLVYAAAERFPGLVPNRARMAAELAVVQADREGHEIDQGIFCAALFRSPRAGRHLVETMLTPTARAHRLRAEFAEQGRVELTSVLLERQGCAAQVTFRNAHCLNAEDNQLIADLETVVDLALLDDQVRVGVLRGGTVNHPRYVGRRVFSAGINLKELRNGKISFVDFLLGRELGYINKIFRGLLVDPANGAWPGSTIHKPWVGAVDSFAIGGGMQLLLVLDRVIAADDAYLSLPAAEEGIVPGLANLRLPWHVGVRLARQVILGGRQIHMSDPQARLLCDDIVPAERITDEIDRAVRELSSPAVAANRRMLNGPEEPLDVFLDYLAEFAVVQSERAYSADVLAKVERRWQGRRERP